LFIASPSRSRIALRACCARRIRRALLRSIASALTPSAGGARDEHRIAPCRWQHRYRRAASAISNRKHRGWHSIISISLNRQHQRQNHHPSRYQQHRGRGAHHIALFAPAALSALISLSPPRNSIKHLSILADRFSVAHIFSA